MKKILILSALFCVILSAVPRVTSVEALDMDHDALMPVFGAGGENILYRSSDGLYRYDIDKGTSSRFAESGYDPVMDAEGIIRYRVDNYEKGRRLTSLAVLDPETEELSYAFRNKRLDAAPKITDHGVYFVEKKAIKSDFAKASRIPDPVAFTYDNAVVLHFYGTSKVLRPAGDRPHLWPSVSPAQDKFCVVGGNDLFICDLDGNVLSKVNDARAPQWSPDGEWIAFMRDRDDGHVITGSDIYLVDKNGENIIRLTDSNELFEMYPQWSPDGSKIICDNPADGKPVLITLEMK
ncbi:MAG: hypothetical protein U5N56_09425 [Candidatus Marinimicrobia bacterium]|nr:hypothetical protein [Candidatus Neomarinimicrobiota bacterium]